MIIDKKLIKAIKKNDRKTIFSLYNFSFNKMMSIVVRYYNNQEDRITIVNNCFLKILKNIDQFKLDTSYFSWISRIVHNEIIDTYRKAKKHKNIFELENFNNIDTFSDYKEEDNDSEYSEQYLLDLINELPEASKIVFNLYAIEGGYTYKELANLLDISTETVKWHLKNARFILRNKLKQKEIELTR